LAAALNVTFGADAGRADRALREAEVLIVCADFPADDLAVRAPRLRWMQSTSAGVETLAPHVPPGVVLTNSSGIHAAKGAEYAITALLMLNHRVPHFVTRQREKRWDPKFATTIGGKAVVIVGVGAIGGEVARLARRFGLRVFGVRRSGRPHRHVTRMFRAQNLSRVLPKADFLVLSTPLTEETRGLIGPRELDLLPRNAGVVNLGRGGVVDETALADRLAAGRLSGAVLDVFEQEPLSPDSPLWNVPNLIVSPHCAVDDAATYVDRCLDIFFDNLRRYLAGQPLRNRVSLDRGY
jgi:phosphoglycerate dehydrogenase-like enzyme